MRWHDGELKTVTQIHDAKKELGETKQASRQWASRVAGWMRTLSDKNNATPLAAIDEIRAVDDVAAIPAFEDVTLKGTVKPNDKYMAPRRLSLAFVSALNKLHEEAATKPDWWRQFVSSGWYDD